MELPGRAEVGNRVLDSDPEAESVEAGSRELGSAAEAGKLDKAGSQASDWEEVLEEVVGRSFHCRYTGAVPGPEHGSGRVVRQLVDWANADLEEYTLADTLKQGCAVPEAEGMSQHPQLDMVVEATKAIDAVADVDPVEDKPEELRVGIAIAELVPEDVGLRFRGGMHGLVEGHRAAGQSRNKVDHKAQVWRISGPS